jgi:hypothetical protein
MFLYGVGLLMVKKTALGILLLSIYPAMILKGQDSKAWIDNNLEPLIEEIMPLKPAADSTTFPTSLHWTVTIRIRAPFLDQIASLILRKSYAGTIEAVSVHLEGKKLSEQVREIIKINPNAGVREVAAQIKLVRNETNDKACPSLVALSEEFEHLSIPAVLPDTVIMDPVR